MYNSQDMETTKVAIGGWIDKEIVYNTMEYYSGIKNEEILPFLIH